MTMRSERWALFRLSDVTAEHAKDLVIRECEARWQRLVDGSPDIVFITDESSRMIYANRALEEQTGYTALHFQMAQAGNDLIHPADSARVAAFLATFVDSDQTYSAPIENRFVTRDGRVLWYASVVSKTQYQGRNALQFVVHNITAERTAFAESARLLEEARAAVRTRDEFLEVAAHELKTPLTSVRGYSQWLLRNGEGDAGRRRQALAAIDRQTAKLAQLVERLLDISQLHLGHLALSPQYADLVTVVRDAIDSVPRPTGAEITFDAPPSLLVVVDPVRIEQVITNLIDNAFRHGPRRGPVEVHLGARAPDRAEITVSDRGQGIPVEDRDRIFEKFYQPRGTSGGQCAGLGLGLHISREIVTLHGGTLSVESVDARAAQRGARFRVTLPLAPT
jgi:PAS domain S-box-containing protein